MSNKFDRPPETFVEEPPDLKELPSELPLLTVRDVVIFPNMVAPLFVGREMSVAAVEEAVDGDGYILLATQKEAELEQPGPEDLFGVGTLASILKALKLADGRLKVLVQGLQRMTLDPRRGENYLKAGFKPFEPGGETPEFNSEIEALVRSVKEQAEKILSLRGLLTPDVISLLDSLEEPGRLADLVASNLRLKLSEAQQILETGDPVRRLALVHDLLNREIEVASVMARIQSQAKEEMGRGQREYYLREQLKAIHRELGESDERTEEIVHYRKALDEADPGEEVREEALKQLRRLDQMNPDSAEAALIRTYLDWIVELPWSKSTRDRLDLKRAKKILDEDHYDLEKVKERILEYLAVRKLNRRMKGPILCLVGPPGVGKTSLGRSVARAMGRKFVRISLGGVHDEAEIRGHRRTYVGAMPGRILTGLKTAGTNNPVFMMDEIDKIGADFRGDPSAALLEVLDPEQNDSFSDHYLNLPFDLSKVMFITTCNMTDTIPSALFDRLEIIELPGYSENEKVKIARRFLLPRQIKENGLKASDLRIRDKTVLEIINLHTRESGLRQLERALGTVCRKGARRKAEGGRMPFSVAPAALDKLLGPPQFLPEMELVKDEVGVVTGLAWTSAGGEVLFVEVSLLKGKGSMMMTGQLGEVMKESAEAALSYIRARSSWFDLADDWYENLDIHIHLPAAAIPKDGPSAGVSLTTAMVSALTGIPVRSEVAMTGEISLRGQVLPVGGLKEKSLAALRAGIKKLILPAKNKRDLVEIPKEVKRQIKIVEVESMDQVLTEALTGPLPGPAPRSGPAPSLARRRPGDQDPIACSSRRGRP